MQPRDRQGLAGRRPLTRHRATTDRLTPSLLALSVAAALGSVASIGYSPKAHAQEAAPPPVSLDEVVVTGSRILRRDNSSNSPILTVDSDAFQSQHGLNFEAYLNQLPEYNPAASPTTTQADVQITPVNSVGIASISLRGFGPNRSLVLVNGKRTVPINALMVTDVNSIPSALIQRVETITGGASAVYGADAVGGVTNFILRDNFEGIQIDTQYGASTNGADGAESRVSAVFGANSSDGKGNIAIGAEAYNRDAVLAVDNDFFTDRYGDPFAPGYFTFLQGTTNYSCQFTDCPNPNAVTGIFGANPFDPSSPNILRSLTFNADGSLFVTNSAVGLSRFKPNPNWSFFPLKTIDASVPPASQSSTGNVPVVDGLKWENRKQLVSAPQDRYSLFATGHYDITDNLTIFARGMLTESETRTSLFGTSVIAGWEAQIPYDPAVDSPLLPTLNYADPAVVAAAIANPTSPAFANPGFIPHGAPGAQHPVPVELAALLNSRPVPNAVWVPGWNPDLSLPPRSTVNTNTVWQLETGLNLKVGENWTGELYLGHGQSSAYNNAAGNLSLERYRALVTQPDYGRDVTLAGNAGSVRPNFGAASVHCTTGFYETFFNGDAPLSQDCFDAVNATLQTRAQNKQDIAEVNFQGVLANMKPGELRAAFGYQHRENSATFVPDILQSTASFTDQVVGVYPTGYLDASTSADDVYAEFLVPLLANKKGARRLELELGVRGSDYEHSDNETTWKSLINWEINDWFRVRGGFNRATRAPNLGELFLNPQEIFTVGGNNYGDPCGLRSTAPFGAGGTGPDPVVNPPTEPPPTLAPGSTPESAQSARLICEAMMGPAGANVFYNVSNAAGGGGTLFNWVNQTGNPDLKSETADTWTWGFVMTSPWKAPLLQGLTLTLDTYRYDIQDAIMLYSVDYANFRCYGAVPVTNAAEAAAQAASPACRLLTRDQASGVPLATTVSYDNLATIKTAGADLALNWRADFADFGSKIKGGLGFNLQANYLDYYKTKQSPAAFDVETDWKGSLGPNLSGTNGGAYDHRLFSTLTYFRDAWSVSLRWRSLPSVWSAQYASQQAIKENNAKVAAGAPGIILGYVPTTEIKADDYRLFDLSFSWNVKPTMTLRGGITNVFDTDPVAGTGATASTAGYPPGTDLTAVCGAAPGCQNPNALSLPVTGTFNGGYYDTIGRRAFVGFNVNF